MLKLCSIAPEECSDLVKCFNGLEIFSGYCDGSIELFKFFFPKNDLPLDQGGKIDYIRLQLLVAHAWYKNRALVEQNIINANSLLSDCIEKGGSIGAFPHYDREEMHVIYGLPSQYAYGSHALMEEASKLILFDDISEMLNAHQYSSSSFILPSSVSIDDSLDKAFACVKEKLSVLDGIRKELFLEKSYSYINEVSSTHLREVRRRMSGILRDQTASLAALQLLFECLRGDDQVSSGGQGGAKFQNVQVVSPSSDDEGQLDQIESCWLKSLSVRLCPIKAYILSSIFDFLERSILGSGWLEEIHVPIFKSKIGNSDSLVHLPRVLSSDIVIERGVVELSDLKESIRIKSDYKSFLVETDNLFIVCDE